MGSRTPRVFVGTSGWSYPHWKGRFYPEDLADENALGFYARHFECVEINNTFYRLPDANTLETWRDGVPARFTFAAKASRYITHLKKLADPARTTPVFFERLEILGGKLGPILFQLPPRWHANPSRLCAFLEALPPHHRCAFEFRDPDWLREDICECLSRHRAALCIYELGGYRSPKYVTSSLIYIRLHGPDGPYRGRYSTRALAGWARVISAWRSQGHEVHCYFDNDELAYAVRNAVELREMLERAQ